MPATSRSKSAWSTPSSPFIPVRHGRGFDGATGAAVGGGVVGRAGRVSRGLVNVVDDDLSLPFPPATNAAGAKPSVTTTATTETTSAARALPVRIVRAVWQPRPPVQDAGFFVCTLTA